MLEDSPEPLSPDRTLHNTPIHTPFTLHTAASSRTQLNDSPFELPKKLSLQDDVHQRHALPALIPENPLEKIASIVPVAPVPPAGVPTTTGQDFEEPEGQEYVTGAKIWLLLVLFCTSVYMDITCRSGAVLFVSIIADELQIKGVDQAWILTAFAIPFAVLLPFFGRLADLFSPKTTFMAGSLGMGITNLICSCVSDKYAFWILRGVSGVFASATVPAAMRLIMVVLPPKQRGTAIGVYSLFGSVANATGLVLAGVFAIINTTGQNSQWRWFFRFVGLISFPQMAMSFYFIPKVKGTQAGLTLREKWRRFDLPGCGLLLGAILLFMIGLTMGGRFGWTSPAFLVPFILSVPIGAVFPWWEKRLPSTHVLVPPSTWKIPNVALLLVVAFGILPMWPAQAVPLTQRWEKTESAVLVAVRLVPQGVFSAAPMFFLPRIPQRYKESRYFLPVCFIVAGTMMIPPIYSHGEIYHGAYWKYYFPAFSVGSLFLGCAFGGVNVAFMAAVPPQMTGVAGALVQVFIQLGSSFTMTAQEAVATRYPGGYDNFKNIQLSWWLIAGWYLLNTILVLVGYRSKPKSVTHHEEQAPQLGGEDEAEASESRREKTH